MYKNILAFSLIVVLLVAAGCSGPKNRKAQSELDTPEYHYNQGIRYIEKNDLTTAKREFELAKSLKAEFAPAYEGLALVDLEQGNNKSAEKNIEKSLDIDDDWVPAMIAKGRLYTARNEYEDAVEEFEDALDDIGSSKSKFDKKQAKMDAYYYMGDAYKAWGKYIEAQKSYQKVLDVDNTNVRASKAIQDLAKYQAAVAGQTPELKKIAGQKQISRSDVAVLFVTELPLDKIFRRSPQQTEIKFQSPGSLMGKKAEEKIAAMGGTDVPADHWAKSFIDEALNKGIIELYPDGSFKPEENVNRAEFARLIEHFLVKAYDDPGIATKYFGSMSPFADVLNTSPIFNAVMVVSSRGIMPGYEDGTFKSLNDVTGTDALDIIRRLKAKF